MFDLAREHGTPMFSSSALRFSSAYRNLPDKPIRQLVSYGGGTPEDYIIHQLEPLIMLLQTGIKRAQVWGEGDTVSYLLEMTDGTRATLLQGPDQTYGMSLYYEDETRMVQADDRFFLKQTDAILEFFDSGLAGTARLPVEEAETLVILAVRELPLEALEQPGEWVQATACSRGIYP